MLVSNNEQKWQSPKDSHTYGQRNKTPPKTHIGQRCQPQGEKMVAQVMLKAATVAVVAAAAAVGPRKKR